MGVSAIVGIVSFVGLFFAPAVIEIEVALMSISSTFADDIISSIDLMAKAHARIKEEKDIQQYKTNLTEANKLIYQMKMELSKVTQNNKQLTLQVDLEALHGLEPVYAKLLQDIRSIHDLCSKPFPIS